MTALRPRLGLAVAHQAWLTHACAPLATDRGTVEPIWRRLDQRAIAHGLADARPEVALSDDPRLRLLLEDGVVLSARWDGGGRHFFQLPAAARPVRLLSRVAVPAEVVGPFVDDRRGLGVLVRAVTLWNGLHDTTIRAADLDLAGWHGGVTASAQRAAVHAPRRAAIVSATRRALATMVRVGFTAPIEGKKLASVT